MAYEKQGFYSGEKLKASQLDAMEDGIINAETVAMEAKELAQAGGGSGGSGGGTKLYKHNIEFICPSEDGSIASYNIKILCAHAAPFTDNAEMAGYCENEPILWSWNDFENPASLLKILIGDGYFTTIHTDSLYDYTYNSFTDIVTEL